jgi:formiminoglutamase
MSPERRARVAAAAEAAAGPAGYTHVVDGRFVGGHITRSYGHPDQGVEAIQMELVQETYMEENGPPFSFLPERAARIQPVLKAVMAAFIG